MTSINEVIAKLQEMVQPLRVQNDARGYFAALYLQMTQRVKAGILAGAFEDGPRMEKLDVLFANRYFDAFDSYKNSTCTGSWRMAFDAAAEDNISVLQHLLCGINAHINLDLGIAAAQTVSGNEIQLLKTDFYRINSIIGDLMGEVQSRLGAISWPMRFLDDLAGDSDSKVANFSIFIAREAAWKVATDLASGIDQHLYIQQLDNRTQQLAQRIISPGFLPNCILKPVKWFEKGSVGEKVGVLLGEGV